MTTTTDAAAQQHDEAEADEPEGGRRLLAAHFEGLDLEAMGLRYHADGGGFDLTTGPSDGRGLTALLSKATALLGRLVAGGRAELAAVGHELGSLEQRAEERLHHWLVRKVRHLVRYALGRLVKLAARQLREGSERKKAARADRKATRRQDSQGAGTRSPRGAGTRKGSAGHRPRTPGQRAGGPHRDSTLSPAKARRTVKSLPKEQVRHLGKGLAPQEVDRVAEQLPVRRAEDAAPVLHQVEHAAQELVGERG